MRLKLIIFIILISEIVLFAQQNYICWDRTYGGLDSDCASCIVQLTDGSYVIGGAYTYKYSDDWYVSHAQLNKLDSIGNIIWEIPYIATVGSPSSFLDVMQTNDGNIVTLTTTEIGPYKEKERKYAAEIIKVNQDGEIIWDKLYTHGLTMSAYSITETIDYGLAICGDSDINDSLQVGIVMKFDQNGDSLWTAELRNDGYYPFINGYENKLYSIGSDSSNYVYSVGVNYDRNGFDSWIVKLNQYGSTVFNIDCGDSTTGDAFYCINVSSNSFFVSGSKVILAKYLSDITVDRFNLEGVKEWEKIFGLVPGTDDVPYSIDTTSDNGCVITGQGGSDLILIRLDSKGDSLWTKRYIPDRPYSSVSAFGYDVQQTKDEGFIVCGMGTHDYVNQHDDMWVLKLNQFGTLSGIEEQPEEVIESYKLIQNYPNPFNNSTNIEYSLKQDAVVELNIFNIKGEFVQNLVNKKNSKGTYYTQFEADNLNSGIYYYQIIIDGIVKDTKRMLYLK